MPVAANSGTFAISGKDDDNSDSDSSEGATIAYIMCPSLARLAIVVWQADRISEGAQPITATFIIWSQPKTLLPNWNYFVLHLLLNTPLVYALTDEITSSFLG
jgi:hypothetical protein